MGVKSSAETNKNESRLLQIEKEKCSKMALEIDFKNIISATSKNLFPYD